jgi:large subunit ribosomal protein L17
MRHRKTATKLGRDPSHRRCTMANMLKNLIAKEKVVTTVSKAKVLKRYADKMVTLAKDASLASRRRAIAKLMIRYNSLTPKEERQAKNGDLSVYNNDRTVIQKLFENLGPRFKERQGGYTRIIRMGNRSGDGAQLCLIEYLEA